MSQRLQVLVDPREISLIRREATHEKKSVSEWVRDLIRERLSRRSKGAEIDPIKALEAMQLPAPPIDQMLQEIDAGRS